MNAEQAIANAREEIDTVKLELAKCQGGLESDLKILKENFGTANKKEAEKELDKLLKKAEDINDKIEVGLEKLHEHGF